MYRLSLIDFAFRNSNYEHSNVGVLMAYRKTLWSGSFRAMINFCKASRNKNRVYMILYKCREGLIDELREHVNISIVEVRSTTELLKAIDKYNIKVVIGDDAIERLKVLNYIKIKKQDVKTIIYVQFLYGVRKLFPIFHEILAPYSIKNTAMNMIANICPWSFLRHRYKNMLVVHDYLIANSMSTANLVFLLYGVKVNSVIYPPVDTDIFKPTDTIPNNDVITLYSGSRALDTRPQLIYDLIKIIISHGLKVNIFGENVEQIMSLYKKLKKETSNNLRIYKNISDTELAKLYSKSYVVVAPQYFELFGYVPVEAMACGTPVIAFGYLGPAETIVDSVTGFLAFTSNHMKQILRNIIKYRPKFDRYSIRRHILKNFSISAYHESKH